MAASARDLDVESDLVFGLRPRRARGGVITASALARGGSACRLAATRGVNLFLKSIEADGADDDILAHHVARRAVEAQCLGELEAFLDRGLHLVARHVLFDLRDVEPDLLRS